MKLKKYLYSASLLSLIFFLSGCVKMDKHGNPDPNGWIYRFLVVPLGNCIQYMVDNWHWNYGWAIIFITIIVRLIILPLNIYQSHKMMVQSEKMQFLKPQLDIIQSKMKEATTIEQQQKAQRDMQRIYSENGTSMFGGFGAGCLPILIQMPIFAALFATARYTPGISSATFYGINLGKTSFALVIITGALYLLQSYLSMFNIPEDQKKQMQMMMYMSPIMMIFFSFSSPAGVALYWAVGGVVACIQTVITNIIMRPRLKAKIAEEMKLHPPKIVVSKDYSLGGEKKTSTKTASTYRPPVKNQSPKANKNGGRNAGKQNRRK